MPAFHFMLECFAVALFAAVATSGLAAVLLHLFARTFERLSSARRADALFLLSMLPAVGTMVVLVGTAAPSLLALFGIGHDHCDFHGHHPHLCIVHSIELRPAIAAIGTISMAMFFYRATMLARSALRTSNDLGRLESLGARRNGTFPAIVVPAPMCHAIGIFRRRILLSDELQKSLTPAELGAALAHEEAHLLRRDPAALSFLRMAGLFSMPALARLLSMRFRQAIEEAADARAAESVADPSLVARALVKVAALHHRSIDTFSSVPAFGRTSLERRVRLLLGDAPLVTAEPLSLVIGIAGILTSTSLALLHSSALHHAVETALSHF
jgi:Zn-dependent protease with chaperone function